MRVEPWQEAYAREVEAWPDFAAMRGPARAQHRPAAWNERAIKLYERLGSQEVSRETRRFELVGDHEFLQMERPA